MVNLCGHALTLLNCVGCALQKVQTTLVHLELASQLLKMKNTICKQTICQTQELPSALTLYKSMMDRGE